MTAQPKNLAAQPTNVSAHLAATDLPPVVDNRLTLAGAAEELGVHYMTAYRYVRTGRLQAHKEAGQWWVDRDELALLLLQRRQPPVPEPAGDRTDGTDDPDAADPDSAADADDATDGPDGQPADADDPDGGTDADPDSGTAAAVEVAAVRQIYATMFRRRATAGDYNGAWAAVTEALTGGASPAEVHLQVIGPAMVEIGELWAQGELSISEEHRASAVATRVIGRMTPLFRRKGRSRLTVVVGSVSGEMHHLPSAMLADLLSERNFDVIDLGGNTPASVFVDTAQQVDGEVVIGVAAATDAALETLTATITHVRANLPDVPLFVGGAGAQPLAGTADVAAVTATAQQAVDLVEELASARA